MSIFKKIVQDDPYINGAIVVYKFVALQETNDLLEQNTKAEFLDQVLTTRFVTSGYIEERGYYEGY